MFKRSSKRPWQLKLFQQVNILIKIFLFEIVSSRKKSMGGGTILDMGVYTIQACQWVLGEEPKSIEARGILNEEGVDIEMTANLDYGDNKKVQINTSALNQYSNSVVIIGTKGQITVCLLNDYTTLFNYSFFNHIVC